MRVIEPLPMALLVCAIALGAAGATGGAEVREATSAVGAAGWRVTTLPRPGGQSSSAEPGIAIGADGIEMIDAASANTGAPPTLWLSRAGGDVWSTGYNFDPSGASTGDADAAVGADGWMYALNLAYAPMPPQQPANPTILVYRSRDGRGWLGPASFPAPHGVDQPDRPWLVVDPRDPANVDVFNSEGGGNIVVWRSTDHGATFGLPVPVAGGANSEAALALSSRPLVDPRDHLHIEMLYETATVIGLSALIAAGSPPGEFPMGQLWLASSTDGGATWANRVVFDTAGAQDAAIRGGTLAHLLVATAIDAGGNLYAAFSARSPAGTQTHVFLIHSRDGGVSWSAPARVDSGSGSNVMPALAVARDGSAYLSWYGSAAGDYRDPSARWAEMAAASADPLSAQPAFRVSQVSGSDPVHIGGIDTAGTVGNDLGDNWGLRDFQSIAVDGRGRPHIVWAVDAGHAATLTAVPVDRSASAAGDRSAQALRPTPATTRSAPPPTLPNTAFPSGGSGTGAAAATLAAAAVALGRRRRRRRAPVS